MVSLLSVTASQGGSVLVLYYSRTGTVLWRFYLAFRGVNYDFVVSIPRNAGLSQCSTRRSAGSITGGLQIPESRRSASKCNVGSLSSH